MSGSNELKRIKKKYGEKFMRLCRELFPTVLEQEGRLEEILNRSFAGNSRTLYEDIVNDGLVEELKSYIFRNIDIEGAKKDIVEGKNPYELLDEAGYVLTECLSEREIQEFKKYYKSGEELCTFNGGRLNRCVVFFAVKKNAEEIKRENFKNPKREDEYGTSVMGIQFNREGLCTVSIKNRYNHTVNNPDATYGNDLDKIALGLTHSFKTLLDKEYGLKLNTSNKEEFQISNYIVANDGRYYKYNMEVNGIYYCPGNVIIENGEPKKLENQILMDYFVLDIKDKIIKLYDEDIEDSFIDDLQDIQDAQIIVQKSKERSKIVTIQKSDKDAIIIKLNSDNQIIGYENSGLIRVGDNFLYDNRVLVNLNLPNLVRVGDDFLLANEELKDLNLPELVQIGDRYIFFNRELTSLELPKVRIVGDQFLNENVTLSNLDLPKVMKVGNEFLINNQILATLSLQSLQQVGDNFLYHNKVLTSLNLPSLQQVGDNFLYYDKMLTSLNLPSLQQVEDNFLYHNKVLTSLNLPKLEKVGSFFLDNNETLINLNLPKLEKVGDYFFSYNEILTALNLSNLQQVGDYFLYRNQGLTGLDLPNLEKTGRCFLHDAEELTNLNLSKLRFAGNEFLYCNMGLTNLNLPELERVGDNFLYCNQMLNSLNSPKLKYVGDNFLHYNIGLTILNLPNLEKIGKQFLVNNQVLTSLNLPCLEVIEDDFLNWNDSLTSLNLPNLKKIGSISLFLRMKLEQVLNQNEKREKSSDDCFSMKDKYSIVDENAKEIDARNIAVLDSQSELTMTDVSMAQNVIEDVFLRKKNKDEK